jgi:hypothetical protein
MLPKSGNDFSDNSMLNFLETITFMRFDRSTKTHRDPVPPGCVTFAPPLAVRMRNGG